MTTVTYRIQEQSKIGGIAFPWRTIPIDWATEDAARSALNNHDLSDPDDDVEYRIVRVTTEVLPCPADSRTGAGPAAEGDRPSLVETFEAMRKASGGRFDEIEDVAKYVADLRGA